MSQDLEFWYDGQLRRYWMQFCRIFEGFQYESGLDANGVRTRRYFPVKLASKDRQIGHIVRNGSENTVMSTPQISCEMTSIRQSAERRQTPNHVRTVNVWERAIDEATQKYTGELGSTYSVETYMAIPYDITMRVNIWTSNEMQKHQFMEQVLILFNPSIDLQTNNNAVDWTSLGIVELLGDEIQWTNREMPIGGDDDIEVSTLSFKVPIWLSPPAKVKRQNIIHQIITNIGMMDNADNYTAEQAGGYNFSNKDDHTRVIVTPSNHQARMEVERGPDGLQFVATLLTARGSEHDEQGAILNWKPLIERYGAFRPGVSQFRLKTTEDMDDHDSDIVGIFGFDASQPNKLWWTPDSETLPRNTLETIDGMIDPNVGHAPGRGAVPEAQEGQRYLLASDLEAVPEWNNLQASMNDIIEFKNASWVISFDASTTTNKFVVLNARSAKQLRWTGEMWVDAIAGDYMPGYWRVFL